MLVWSKTCTDKLEIESKRFKIKCKIRYFQRMRCFVRPVHVVIRVAINKETSESGVSVDVQYHVQLIFA